MPFSIEKRDGDWLFTIKLTEQRIITDILQNRMELNLFVVETHDEQKQVSLIFADSMMGYLA